MAGADPTAAIALLEGARMTGRDTGNLPLEASALSGLGQCFEKCGRLEEASAAARRALSLHDDLGMRAQAQYDVFTLAHLAEHVGDHRSAETLVRDGIGRALEIADRHAVAVGLGILAGLLARRDLAAACHITAARTSLLDAIAVVEDDETALLVAREEASGAD